uniref:Undecaprenyl/decaprenyl-phosphate alpha-N-acetylglucosaminyl 1-phosphate transferase n=1 Tax=candidate division CPR3 bacterium TaxID=2268181 RepID=A0A7C4R3C3_UNCC3
MFYFVPTIILSFLVSFAILGLSKKYKWLDIPDEKRKIHQKPIPNLGGIAIYVSFWLIAFGFLYFNQVQGDYFKYIIGLFIGSLILFITGIIDDRKKLNPNIKFISQIIAGLTVIAAGVGITYINNPLGGFIFLNQIQIPVLNISGTIYQITLLADIFALFWIVGMINVVNFLDGLDGLASGVAIIAFIVIYFLSISPTVNQPLSAIIALIALGSVLGFLPFNLSPAKMFMGDTGSMFLGFLLSTLAIISGGKLATALLVLGLPIFDGVWVVSSRVLKGNKPWTADRSHLHHKLIDLGFSRRKIVILYWFITAIFGAIALISGSTTKFYSLFLLIILMIGGMMVINTRLKNKNI